MAITVAARSRAHVSGEPVTVPPGVLAVALVAPAIDLFMIVQPAVPLSVAAMLFSGVAAAALMLVCLRYARVSWLLGAAFAAITSALVRLVGADVAPLLSLLSIVALGVGGAFAPSQVSQEAA